MENKDFIWTDEQVKEFVTKYNEISGWVVGEDPIMYEIRKFKASKQPKPLFKTDDGVDIYIDDVYYLVNKNYSISPCSNLDYLMTPVLAKFKSHEKAEEYILMNKPLLSLNDILECNRFITDSHDVYVPDIRFEKLKELAKQKLSNQ